MIIVFFIEKLMAIGEDLLKKLRKKFEPSAMVRFRYRTNDIAVQTDKEGNAILLFIGKMDEEGTIRGDRYSRVMVRGKDGAVVKDHWDRKGRAT
jgi:hypothetical protein